MGHRLVSGIRDLLSTVIESLFSTSEAESLPRADVLKYGGNLQTVALLLVVLVLIVPMALVDRAVAAVIYVWVVVVLVYVVLYQFSPGLQGMRYRTIVHTMMAVGALLGLNIFLHRAGYGRAGRDPYALWLAYLVPLFMISRHGKTRYWTLILGLIIAVFLGFRAYSVASTNASYFQEVSLTIPVLTARGMLMAYREAIVLLLTAAIYHASVREMHYYKSRVTIEREFVDLLTKQPSFSAAYQAAAEETSTLHRPVTDYTFVLLRDEPSKQLKVVGVSGLPLDRWQELELEANQGITGQVVAEKRTIRVPDVRQPPWNRTFYGPGQLAAIRSEMAAPIVIDDDVIGVLDVESRKIGAYTRYHQAKLEALAQSLSLSYKHYQSIDRQVAHAHLLFDDIVKLGHMYNERQTRGAHVYYRSWFRAVAKQICSHFNADYAALVRLGVGTAFPLLPPVVWPRAELASLKTSFRHHSKVVPNSVVSRLIDEWKIRDWCTREEWNEWSNPDDQWLLDEFSKAGVSTLYFLPIGPFNDRLAMLFLGFRRPEMLTDMGMLTLQGLIAALENSYNRLSPWTSELHHAGIRIHQNVITRAQGTFARVDAIRNSIRRLTMDQQTAGFLENTLDEIGDDVRKLRQQIKHATLQERFDLNEIKLEFALKITADDFQDIDPERLKIPVIVDARVEKQEIFVRQMLYWIAVEAIANAIEHGKATLVSVNLQTAPGLIRLVVTDNGIGMPPSPNRHQPHGIFYLKRLVYHLTNANLSISQNDPYGVKVELCLPIRSNHP